MNNHLFPVGVMWNCPGFFCVFFFFFVSVKRKHHLMVQSLSQAPAELEEKAAVATETEAAPAKSTGPTVNIQTTEAAKAEPVHTAAELTVKTISAKLAEGELDDVVLQEDVIGSNSSVGDTQSDAPSEKLEQDESVELVAEKELVSTHLGLDESMSACSALPESAVLTLIAEKEIEEVIAEEGEDAGVEGEAMASKDRFTVAPAYIRDYKKDDKMPSTEEENGGVEAADFENTGEGTCTEVDGKRVQFSNKVQYFEEQEVPAESEDDIEEVDEEMDECSPGKDEIQKATKPLPFEKEKYHYAQTDSSEDETEEEEADGKREELEEEYDEELKLAEDGVDEKASAAREDGMAAIEEIVQTEELEEEVDEQDKKFSPHEATSGASLTRPPPDVSQSEVTMQQLQWPPPRHCNPTSILHSCRHNLPLIIKGKTRPKAWICVATC